MKSLEHYRNRPNTVEAEKLELIAKVLRLPGHKVKRTKSCITITFTAESGAKCVARCEKHTVMKPWTVRSEQQTEWQYDNTTD